MDSAEEEILMYINNELRDIQNTINEELYYDNKQLNSRNEFNNVKMYIDDFLSRRAPDRFVVLPGLRGVGKSVMLYQIYDYLLKKRNIAPDNILYLPCDELYKTFRHDIKKTVEVYIKNKFNASLRTLSEKFFILVDETQYDAEWALTGKIIYDKSRNIFMIFTGSSAIHLEYNADAARRLEIISIPPLNYTQHLKLKYNNDVGHLSPSLKELIFSGNVDNAIMEESKVNALLSNNLEYNFKDWNFYFRYGGFPSSFEYNSLNRIRNNIVKVTERIITEDMPHIDILNSEDEANANRILRYVAKQQPGEISNVNLANYLKTPVDNVNTIMDFLEKTHLLFHCEPYGGAAKRTKKAWKYYFATSSIRYALAKKTGHPLIDTDEFEGILIENLIASNLFNLFNEDDSFIVYYDANQKKNVDFLIQNGLDYPIPIEVGRADMKDSQIKYAMDKYGAPYGIVVANNTNTIQKIENVIYIPVKTFSFL